MVCSDSINLIPKYIHYLEILICLLKLSNMCIFISAIKPRNFATCEKIFNFGFIIHLAQKFHVMFILLQNAIKMHANFNYLFFIFSNEKCYFLK